MSTSTTGHDSQKSIRDYDKARMHRIALAMYGGLLTELRDDEGRVYLPSGEIMDAMAMLGGMILSSHPDAAVPSRLREMCGEHAKRVAHDCKLFKTEGSANKLFDVILTDRDTFQ